MQVMFRLPVGGSGIPAGMKASHIRGEVLLWCVMHRYMYQDIELERIFGAGLLLTFKKQDMFNVFRLTWSGTDYERYREQL